MSSIELPEVIRAFTESRETLDAVRDRLSALALAEETTSTASRTLDAAAEAMRQGSEKLSAFVDVLATGHQEVRNALDSAKTFLEQADLSGLRKELGTIGPEIEKVLTVVSDRSAIENLTEGFAKLTSEVQQRVDSLATSIKEEFESSNARPDIAKLRDAVTGNTKTAAEVGDRVDSLATSVKQGFKAADVKTEIADLRDVIKELTGHVTEVSATVQRTDQMLSERVDDLETELTKSDSISESVQAELKAIKTKLGPKGLKKLGYRV